MKSGGQPLFPTCEAASVESFKTISLKGQEGRLAPAVVLLIQRGVGEEAEAVALLLAYVLGDDAV
jgi:hypothetical protein